MDQQNTEKIQQIWAKHYEVAEKQLHNMQKIQGVATGFNVNIDAVIKIKPELIQQWIKEIGATTQDLFKQQETRSIKTPLNFLQGYIQCFTDGKADEWYVEDINAYKWMKEHIDPLKPRNQMGGQTGIIANIMSVCGVQKVYAHAISLSQNQVDMFVNKPNLYGVNDQGKLEKIKNICRQKDNDLIHWILEFNKGDVIQLADKTVTCPRANRLIGTYDPDNLDLRIDPKFSNALKRENVPIDFVLLSGYQLMNAVLSDGTDGLYQVNQSWKEVQDWKATRPNMWVHLEFAATKEKKIFKHLITNIAPQCDSLGMNEQELLEVLETCGMHQAAKECLKNPHSQARFDAVKMLMEQVFPTVKRIQLHMFGFYVTILSKYYTLTTPQQVKNGMIMASTIAASKAGTGSVDDEKNLLWSKGQLINDVSVKELVGLSTHIGQNNKLVEEGIFKMGDYTIVAIPSIIVPNPKTLVGMGDTISSLSLVGAGNFNDLDIEHLSEIQQIWKKHYEIAEIQLENMKKINGVVAAFNVNIDAVIKIPPKVIQEWVKEIKATPEELLNPNHSRSIKSPFHFLQAYLQVFKDGKADEWYVEDINAYKWMKEHIDPLKPRPQMGGQTGIIANIMSVCGVQKVYAHAISLSENQSKMFVNKPNLLGVNDQGEFAQISTIKRKSDNDLIHWILEFNKDDVIEIGNVKLQCPRANRLIGTYDPDNLDLRIDPKFSKALKDKNTAADFVLLSGYQLMASVLSDGSNGLFQVNQSWKEISDWKAVRQNLWVHLEFAATKEPCIFKHIIQTIGKQCDSIGMNEQELLDVLETCGYQEEAEKCKQHPNAVTRFEAVKMLIDKEFQAVKRIQLHMFGFYISFLTKHYKLTTPEQVKNGMILAATIAAAKAKTGNVDVEKNLMASKGELVGEVGVKELIQLSKHIGQNNKLIEQGICQVGEYTIIATPSIIIPKPLTLVGMGDTISSISIVGAGNKLE